MLWQFFFSVVSKMVSNIDIFQGIVSKLEIPVSWQHFCIPYLDDILCYAKTFEDHLEGLRRVLKALQQHGVKLRPKKCEFFKREVRYVGRLVSGEGVRVDPKDLDAILSLKEKSPSTIGEVRWLLGFLSYYRTYIQDFSRIAKPIYDLLQVKNNDAHVVMKKNQQNRREK